MVFMWLEVDGSRHMKTASFTRRRSCRDSNKVVRSSPVAATTPQPCTTTSHQLMWTLPVRVMSQQCWETRSRQWSDVHQRLAPRAGGGEDVKGYLFFVVQHACQMVEQCRWLSSRERQRGRRGRQELNNFLARLSYWSRWSCLQDIQPSHSSQQLCTKQARDFSLTLETISHMIHI